MSTGLEQKHVRNTGITERKEKKSVRPRVTYKAERRKTRTLFPSLRTNHVRERKGKKEKERTNADNRAIFRLFVLCGNGRWTEEDECEEEEEGKGERGEEARGLCPRWTGHVEGQVEVRRAFEPIFYIRKGHVV